MSEPKCSGCSHLRGAESASSADIGYGWRTWQRRWARPACIHAANTRDEVREGA